MKSISFNDGTLIRTIGHYNITNITNEYIILGNSKRNIDGELITYKRGSKLEYSIDLEEICRETFDWLVDFYLNQTKLVVTITNDINNNTDTLNAIIEMDMPNYDNLKGNNNFSIKVRQYD